MKFKYNFGLLKNVRIGFKNACVTHIGEISNVKLLGELIVFNYKSGERIEIEQISFIHYRLEKIDGEYYFTPSYDSKVINGMFVFTMFDTFGFPPELVEEEMYGYEIDKQGFDLLREIQKNKTKDTFKNKDAF